ncbi:hypothetical protein HDU76_004325, partial [Blyttiomyces sp. JEL0837]
MGQCTSKTIVEKNIPLNTEASHAEPPRGVVTSNNQSPSTSDPTQKPTNTTTTTTKTIKVVDGQPSGRKKIQVFVKTLSGKTLAVTMITISTVFDLKRFLEIKTGVPVERQRLIYTRFNDLHDFQTLAYYGIEHECLIIMALRFKIEPANLLENWSQKDKWVNTLPAYVIQKFETRPAGGSSVNISSDPNDNIKNSNRGSTKPERDSTNTKANKTFKITIKTLKNQSFEIEVVGTNTDDDLKAKIQDKVFMPPDVQKLVYNGKQLKSDCTLNEVGICEGSVLFLLE